MLILIGAFIVIASTLGGFMIAGGNPLVLLHVSEFVVILGVALGVVVIASPMHTMIDLLKKIKQALSGKHATKAEYMEMLKMLYEIFMVGRRNGLIALEEHVMNPAQSSIFAKYSTFTAKKEQMEFLLNGIKPVIDGKIKPDQLEDLMTAEMHARDEEKSHPVHLLGMVGDSLPAIGIVAAVLGIINTMSAIAEGPEAVGEKVAAALTGTLLGIFVAYGFVIPLGVRIAGINQGENQVLRCIMSAVSGFAKGLAPLTAVEVARRGLDSTVQPGAEELENTLKAMPSIK
jgi:chemotaxis protein MotA